MPSTVRLKPEEAPRSQTEEALLQRYIPKQLLSKLEDLQEKRLIEGERRVVTILFCDIEGSTLAASRLDPEDWAGIINGAFEYMIEPVYRYEGTVARLQGDGLLAFFGAPIAHEDDPQRAVLAGLGIVEASRSYGKEIKEQWGIDFNIRVGINTGLVVVGEVGSDLRVEYSALGDAINLAARMEQTAQAGTVQIAEATKKLVAPLFELKTVEGLIIKGRETPITAYRVLGEKASPGSLRGIEGLNAPLVGRKVQMATLHAVLDELKQGSGQIVSVMGEAGLGKSRLIAEFHREVMADSDFKVHWLEGRALSFEANIPFAPFINMLTSYFELDPAESDRSRYQQIEKCLRRWFPRQSQEMSPFFATLLNISLEPEPAERVKFLQPPQLRGTIFAHFISFIVSLLAHEPVVIYVDDLHWTDPTSLDLLQALLPLVDQYPLMLILAFRPREQELSWKFHELVGREHNHHYRVIALEPLDKEQSRALVSNLLHIDDLPESLREKILDKSEGNPFFVEEMIRSLLDSGLVIKKDGHWRATADILNLELPDTLAGVITARLDRLEDFTRHIIQSASVIGREFSYGTLIDILRQTDSIEEPLIELQRRELIREKSRHPQWIFAFKHVLTQEAAYNSILLSNRRQLHLLAADSFIARTPDAASDIARHLLLARQSNRALPYLIEAGDRASRSYATTEAIDYYLQALKLKSLTKDRNLLRRAYEGLGSALAFANRIPESQSNYQEMLAAAESYEDVPMQISALNKMAGVLALTMGQFQEAEHLLSRAESLFRKNNEKAGFPETALIRCQMCTAQADFTNVIRYMDEVIKIGKELDQPQFIATGLDHVSSSLVYMLRFDEAMEKAVEALKISRQIGDRENESWLLSNTLPLCHIRNGDFELAHQTALEGLEIGQKIGAQAPQTVAGSILAEIARWRGEYEQALKYGKQALNAALPLEQFMPFMLVPVLGSLGIVYLEISDQFIDQVARFHSHALRLLETPVGRLAGGTAWATLGFCAIQLGDLKVAEEVITQGLNYPNMFMHLERPRNLAGAALLACTNADYEHAIQLAQDGRILAEASGMKNVYALISLVTGQILHAKGENAQSLEAFEQAEREAEQLGMRVIAWQANAYASSVLAALGQSEKANVKNAAAKEIVEEIASQIGDQELRESYLDNAFVKITEIGQFVPAIKHS